MDGGSVKRDGGGRGDRDGSLRFSRRAFLAGVGALTVGGACAAERWLADFPGRFGTPAVPDDPFDLAARFVAIAERNRSADRLWGRMGGSPEERDAGELLAAALRPFVDDVTLEDFELRAARPKKWSLAIGSGAPLASAMPAPIDGLFPAAPVSAPVVVITSDADWAKAAGAWAYVAATMKGTAALNSVRDGKLYDRAVEVGARGFVFSLPMPPGTWRVVAPIDKAFALGDSTYPDGRRPIPGFCVDSEDGARILAATGSTLTGSIDASERERATASNVVARIHGELPATIGVMTHLDSFFSGANDNASGLATLVGLTRTIHERRASGKKSASFVLVGLAAHHDGGAGMRAFHDRDRARFSSLTSLVLIEHTDAQAGTERALAGWPADFNDRRQAFLGSKPWPEIEPALPALVRETGLMTVDPPTAKVCISDLLVVCDELPTFCLIEAPPYYHTDHDTLDKISRDGIEHAVRFHTELLERIGALTAG